MVSVDFTTYYYSTGTLKEQLSSAAPQLATANVIASAYRATEQRVGGKTRLIFPNGMWVNSRISIA